MIEKLGAENLEDFEDIIDQKLMKNFRLSVKTRFNGEKDCIFEVRGLKDDSSRGFQQGKLVITRYVGLKL